MKKLFLILTVVFFASLVSGQSPAGRGRLLNSGLRLQNAVFHNGQDQDATQPNTTMTPWDHLWMRGAGVSVKIRFYTSYTSKTMAEHKQRVVLYNASGAVVAEANSKLATYKAKAFFPNIYLAESDPVLKIPPQPQSALNRFGVWIIKVWVDNELMLEYPFAMVAQIPPPPSPERVVLPGSGLMLQSTVYHNGSDQDAAAGGKVSVFSFLWAEGAGATVRVRFYTTYLGDSERGHNQRIEILNPKGNVITKTSNSFITKKIPNSYPDIFIGRLDEIITLPPQPVTEPFRFGILNAKIWADDTLVAEFPIPLIARESK